MNRIKKTLLAIFFTFLMIILFISGICMLSYINWEKSFEKNLILENMSSESNELSEEVMKKIASFVNSSEKTDFIEFTTSEISLIFDYILNSSIEGITFEKVYFEPQEDIWKLYTKSKIGGVSLPWVSMDLIKDDMETAELYIKDIYIGNFELPDWVSKNIVTKLNKGVSQAILLFNENLFSKRYIQNIELKENFVVVKGILY